jgi:hypothetical protein
MPLAKIPKLRRRKMNEEQQRDLILKAASDVSQIVTREVSCIPYGNKGRHYKFKLANTTPGEKSVFGYATIKPILGSPSFSTFEAYLNKADKSKLPLSVSIKNIQFNNAGRRWTKVTGASDPKYAEVIYALSEACQ